LVARVHGGAVAPSRSAQEPAFALKVGQHQTEKARIGALAASRVEAGDAVALSAGTTTLAVARALTALPHFATLTVITNPLPAAALAASRGAAGAAGALSAGTATRAAARALTALPPFATPTGITASLPAAGVLHQAAMQAREAGRPAPTVVLTGGERTPSDALV